MASLSITNTEIKERLAMLMGVSRTEANWAGNSTILADVNRIIRAGRRKFFSAYDWSFLEVRHDIAIPAPLKTGTIAIVNGVVTLTGSTFPTNTANQYLFANGSLYQINTRDSTTQLTLLDLTINLPAGTKYVLYYARFALPSNFAALVGPFTIENSQIAIELQELPVIPEHQVRGLLSKRTAYAAQPKAFSIFHIVNSETGIATHFINLYPFPDVAYFATARIRVSPGDSLAESGDVFGAEYSELMLEAILSACEQIYNDSAGLHTDLFVRMLPDFIRKDKIAQGARRLLPRKEGRRGGYPRNYELIVSSIDLSQGVL